MKKATVILSTLALFIGQQSYGQKWNKTVPHTLYGVDNMHDTSDIQVGIGVAHPLSPLEVKGQIIADSIRVTKILGQGDSLIHLGHNSILVNYAVNTIQWSPTFAFQFCNGTPMAEDGLGIGNGNTFAFGMNAMALGTNVQIPICPVQSMVLGAGVSNTSPLVNNTANSMYIGFNSTIPTVFVGPSSGAGTMGKVGIGTTSPLTALHVATVGAQPGYITSDPLATGFSGPAASGDGLVIANNVGTMYNKINFTGSSTDVLTGNGTFINLATASNAWILTGNTLSSPAVLGTLNSYDLRIFAGGSQRMVVKWNSGYVGIGISNPFWLLDVANSSVIKKDINLGYAVIGGYEVDQGYRINGNTVLQLPNDNTGANNTWVGRSGNPSTTPGINNTYVGFHTGFSTGPLSMSCTFIGENAGYTNGATGNTFGGYSSGYSNSNGDFNTFYGITSGYTNSTGAGNAFFGGSAGYNNNGGNNTFIGASSGVNNTTGNSNTTVGGGANVIAPGIINNATAIGAGAVTAQNFQMELGGNNTTITMGMSGLAPTTPVTRLELNTQHGVAPFTVTPTTISPVQPGATGWSGLRFDDLTTASTATFNPGSGVLSVNSNGDVIYVQNNAANGFGYCPSPTALTGSAGYNLNNTANFYFAGNAAGTAVNNIIIGNPCTYTPQAKLDVLQASGSTTGSIGIYVENDDLANTTPTPPIGIKAKMPPISYSNTGYTVAGWFEAPWPLNVPNTVSYSIFVPPASTASPPHYQGIVSVGLALGSHPGSADLIQLAGDGYATGTWFSASDRRYKNNFIPLTNALQKIDSINPVYFYFDTVAYPNMSFSSKKQVGFIAQNVDSVLPEVVQKNDSGYYNLDYSRMTVLLLAGEKELKAKTDSLTGLKQTVDSLRTTLNSIEACISSLCDDSDSHHHHDDDDRMLGGNNGNTQNVTLSNAAILYQNTPNPFGTGGTKINYYLPQGTTGASIVFFDQYGNKLSQVPLTQTGMGSINVNPNRLSNGIYTYSLLINGTVNDTKKMVFSK